MVGLTCLGSTSSNHLFLLTSCLYIGLTASLSFSPSFILDYPSRRVWLGDTEEETNPSSIPNNPTIVRNYPSSHEDDFSPIFSSSSSSLLSSSSSSSSSKFSFAPETDNRYEKIYLQFISKLPSIPKYPKFTPKLDKKFFVSSDKRGSAFWEDQYESPLRGSLVQRSVGRTDVDRTRRKLNLDVDSMRSSLMSTPFASSTSSSLISSFTESPTFSTPMAANFGFTHEPRSPVSQKDGSRIIKDRNSFLKRKTFRDSPSLYSYYNEMFTDLSSSTTSTTTPLTPSYRPTVKHPDHRSSSFSDDLMVKESQPELTSMILGDNGDTPENNCRTIVKQVTEIPGVRPKKIVKLIRSRRGLASEKHLVTFYMSKNCTDPVQNIRPQRLKTGPTSSKSVKVSIYQSKFLNKLKLPEESEFES